MGGCVGVAEVDRYRQHAVVADIVEGRVNRDIGRIGFGAARKISSALGDGDACLGHPDAFDEVPRGLGDHDPAWVGVADVFTGEDGESARDEAGVFARVEHPRDPVEGGVWVAASDGFDHGGGGVVVAISAVVGDFLLDGVFGDLFGDVEGFVF